MNDRLNPLAETPRPIAPGARIGHPPKPALTIARGAWVGLHLVGPKRRPGMIMATRSRYSM
jgi:hypothetical protein